MKKILVLLLAFTIFLGLTACSNEEVLSTEDTENINVKIYKGRYIDLFEDDIKERLKNIAVDGIDERLLSYIGTKFPKIKFRNYEGKYIKLPENKTILFEVISPWCQYCQDMTKNKVIDDVMKIHKDVEYYQYFTSPNENDVKNYYEEAESEIPNGLNVLLANVQFDNWLLTNNFNSIPMVIIINSDGNVGLSYVGLSEAKTFSELITLTTTEMNKPLKDMDENIYEYMKYQIAARNYIKDLEEISVPKEYFE